ncbi:hypothetical protein [Celeribacter indicus]|uniref:Nutrient deprivation-induced protein n=1 Tax=Celeribacter indicus TaxID=1208324 RepID=A0A0B5E6J9_9RHOB|nr:hypothetical protein [Celeribacter indicus]AJE49080.1 hypothetical protein P73_4365 [Celeribacter indicus]SDW45371.1 hypothetical protein SAMN05443573_103290 [Celeribacter indicus]
MTTAETGQTEGSGSDMARAAKSLRDDLSAKTQETAGEVRERLSDAAHDQKAHLAEEGASIAASLRKAAEDMRSGSPQERTMAQIADSIADASETVRDKDFGEMARDLSGFARRNPLVFLGGAMLLGATAARFAKASARNPRLSAGSYGSSSREAFGSRPGSAATTPGEPAATTKEARP